MGGRGDKPRIHIAGAAGTGVSTLGLALAGHFGVPHLETDDFYWLPVDPPYSEKRPVAERVAQIAAAQDTGGWVLSGSLDGWGDALVAGADLVVFMTAPTPVRLARLKRRERARYGDRIGPGGDMERIHRGFLDWAAQYDDPGFLGRSRLRHESWLKELAAPVLRLSGTEPLEALVAEVLAAP